MKRCVIIYNPKSGTNTFIKKLDYVVKRLEESNYDVTIWPTKKSGHATDLAKKACKEQFDLLLCSGGDGTFHEVTNGICFNINLAYIPSGTACDIARTLKLSKNVEKAMDTILNGVVAKMDITETDKRKVVYAAAIGAYVEIPYTTDSNLKKYLGYFAYLLTGIKSFFTIPRIKAVVKTPKLTFNGTYSLILIVNSKRVAGLKIIDYPTLDDGEVDIILYRYIPFFNNILYFLSFVLSARILPGVTRLRSDQVSVETEHRVHWDFDGEKGEAGNLNLTVLQKEINVVVSKKIKNKYFKNQ